jgi:hypothetical protein
LKSLALPRGEREANANKHLAEDLGKFGCIEFQSASGTDPKLKFQPLDHSVYVGWRDVTLADVSEKKWSPVWYPGAGWNSSGFSIR